MNYNLESGGLPDDAATIEHLFSKYDIRRWTKPNKGEKRRVMACYGCNQARAERENAMMWSSYHMEEEQHEGMLIKLLADALREDIPFRLLLSGAA